ncbi:hypothetical protein COOONC_27235 [Cooperia oncophora]
MSSKQFISSTITTTRRGSSIVSTDNSSLSRDFVYSLHHNFKSSLLYGKNNVCVANGDQPPVKGYLSLHKSYEGELSLRWTPNQLMHASSQPSSASGKEAEQQWLWKQGSHREYGGYHLHSICTREVNESSPSSLTLVNCDGVQCPPLQMSAGQHSLVFLATLESGLAPTHRLDPPLWSGPGKEKALPRLRKRTSAVGTGAMLDYVFRIVRVGGNEFLPTYKQEEEEEPLLPPAVESQRNAFSLVMFQDDHDSEGFVLKQMLFAHLEHMPTKVSFEPAKSPSG